MKLHHIALIVSDLDRSLEFYQDLLGFKVVQKIFRMERQSYKVDLSNGEVQLEMFTFSGAPSRPSYPEAQGLRHLAFEVSDIEAYHQKISGKVKTDEIRLDPFTGKKFFFFPDPDNLPIEIYEA